MGTLYLVRHGQASFGAANYDQLSELGWRQSRRLGEHFLQQGRRFDAIMTGTLQRHAQTLEGIQQGLGTTQPSTQLPGLNEYDSEAVIAAMEQRLHRAPREEEVAAELGLSIEEYHEWLVEIRGLNLGSLETPSGEDDSRDLLQFVSDDEEQWPNRILERSELKRILAEAISSMPLP